MAAAISRRGHARDLLLAGISGELELALSPLVLLETERNIFKKAPSAWGAFKLLTDALPATLVAPTRRQVQRAATITTLKDAPIIAGAVRARAAFLATYDRRHLRAQATIIQQRFDLVVTTPDVVLRSILGDAADP
jgi:predicted nucleic acid-binding protein